MQKVLDHCKQKGEGYLWEDESFPPSQKALGKNVPNSTWMRPKEFLPDGNKPALFYQGAKPDDIVQGILGDCYFLSSLSVLAEEQERIEKLFKDHIDNPYGVYCVTLYLDGEPTQVSC